MDTTVFMTPYASKRNLCCSSLSWLSQANNLIKMNEKRLVCTLYFIRKFHLHSTWIFVSKCLAIIVITNLEKSIWKIWLKGTVCTSSSLASPFLLLFISSCISSFLLINSFNVAPFLLSLWHYHLLFTLFTISQIILLFFWDVLLHKDVYISTSCFIFSFDILSILHYNV